MKTKIIKKDSEKIKLLSEKLNKIKGGKSTIIVEDGLIL